MPDMPGAKVGYAMNYPPGAGWRDLPPKRVHDGRAAKAPDYAAFRGGIERPRMAANKSHEVHVIWHMNHDYRVGSDVYLHVHWSPSSTAAGVVEFTIEWSYARMQQGIDPAFTFESFSAPQTILLAQEASGSEGSHQVVESAPFMPPNLDTDGLVLARIARIGGAGADTYPDGAWFLGTDLHHEVGQIATHNRTREDGWIY